MKSLVSFILACLMLSGLIPSIGALAEDKKDVEPFFAGNNFDGIAVKNDGTLWEFDAYEFSVK